MSVFNKPGFKLTFALQFNNLSKKVNHEQGS